MTPEIIERIRHSVLLAIGRPPGAGRRDASVARTRNVNASQPVSDVAALIDHTLLKPDAAVGAIQALCAQAMKYRFATVCVNPFWVATCAALVQGSGVAVCAVTAFPLGASTSAVKTAEAEAAIADGAREIDMVMNIGALKSEQLSFVADDIQAVTTVCRRHGVLSKVILETTLLSDEEKVVACVVAQACGADYVKTSTGFLGGATVGDVALLRQVVGDELGVKASGGIRERDQVDTLLAAGASRIGTSSGVSIADAWHRR